mmetsp:Transcript_7421/g.8391  ORF Transcript_7421/g.8391 Transcript_7421/m.8391 type:complete len:107 (+) Transcript_7421:2-322(+)
MNDTQSDGGGRKAHPSAAARELVMGYYDYYDNTTAMTKEGIIQLASNEGYVGNNCYSCPASNPTIGIGLNLIKGNPVPKIVFAKFPKYDINLVREGKEGVEEEDIY